MSKQGEFLKLLRRKQGLTQKDLADQLNVSDKVISKWEVGDSFPDYPLLMPLANILKVDVQEILNGEYNPEKLQEDSQSGETAKVIYVEKKEDNKPITFKDKIIRGLKFLHLHKEVFFASLIFVSILLMFCNFIKWPYAQYGFYNNYFKFLFVPFQNDINGYLYNKDYVGSFLSMAEKNTNFLAYIISGLVYLYLLILVISLFIFIKSFIKKNLIDINKIFKLLIFLSVFSIVFIVLSFVLKSKLISTMNSTGMALFDASPIKIKTASFFPLILNLIIVTFASIFKYVKSLKVDDNFLSKDMEQNDNNSNVDNIEKHYKTEKVDHSKRNKIIKIVVSLILIIGVGIGAVFFTLSKISTPKNTIKAYLKNINNSNYNYNLNLIYGLTDEEKATLTYYQATYMLYSELKLNSINKVYEENNVGVYNVSISGFYTASGKSSMFTYKYDLILFKDNGKWKLFEPLSIEEGTTCKYDIESKCITRNSELMLYFGNNVENFIIPSGITSVNKMFFDNLQNKGGNTYSIIYNVSTSNPKSYRQNGGRITLSEPSKTGYTFSGWIGSDINGVSKNVIIDSGSTGHKYYIAVWNPIIYSITYENVDYNSNPVYYTIESDEITLSYPTKTGATFIGWTGTGLNSLTANVKIPVGSYGDRTYTANYSYDNFTITYNLNGGSFSNNYKTSYNVDDSFTLQTPTKNGYTFTGWTGSNGTTPQKTVTINKGTTGSKTYTANWQIETYSITYTLNGGSISGTNKTSYTVNDNFTLINPTKDGYTFTGWTGSNGSTPQKTITIPSGSTGNKTYTANWAQIYTITYNLNGGSVSGNPTSYNKYSNTIILNNPSKNGYEFIGWTGSNGSTPQNTVTIPSSSTGNKTYTANWAQIYTITYNLNGGSVSRNPTNYNKYSNSITLNNPSKNGYEFIGWTGSNGSTPQKTVTIPSGSTENKTYTANWAQIYIIIYDLNGGTNSVNNPAYYTVETETITLASPTKENWYFAGWFDDSLFTNRVIRIIKGTTGNITLYAKWSSEPLPYILNNDGTIDFGSYPQTKVTDSSLITSLTDLAGTKPSSSNSAGWISYKYYIGTNSINSGINTTDFMWYKDISYSSNKYRAVYFTSYRPNYTHDSISTSHTYQDDNGYYISTLYFFKFEPINWRILTQKDDKALLMCNMIIDSQEYYNSTSSRRINGKTVYANNYAESNIRKWLNYNFYNTAFSELEKQLILLTNVDNSARSTNPNNNATELNGENNSYACENTEDYIFLLSEQEVTNSNYGFNSSKNNYDTARQLKGTDYAKLQGLWVYTTSSGYSYTGCSDWWLRSPLYDSEHRSYYVRSYGTSSNYYAVYSTVMGVVPALWITL